MMANKVLSAFFLLLLICLPITSFATKIDLVLVEKSKSRMYLKSGDKVIKEYRVAFGANPKGHKQQEGDERTPEGRYLLDYKKANSAYYKAIHISYPNKKDKQYARKMGVNPGGAIMIHGQKNGWGWLGFISRFFNWTNGCIAVTNPEMEEIWNLLETGTVIEIRP